MLAARMQMLNCFYRIKSIRYKANSITYFIYFSILNMPLTFEACVSDRDAFLINIFNTLSAVM